MEKQTIQLSGKFDFDRISSQQNGYIRADLLCELTIQFIGLYLIHETLQQKQNRLLTTFSKHESFA